MSEAANGQTKGESRSNSALTNIDRMLVFTGEIGDSQTDWMEVVREERDGHLLRNSEAASAE